MKGDQCPFESLALSCACLNYQIECSAEHDFCPRFEGLGITHVSGSDSGELRLCEYDDCEDCGGNDFYASGRKGFCATTLPLHGETTAPPFGRALLRYDDYDDNALVSPPFDLINMMQRPTAMAEAGQFGVAAERGLAYTRVFRLTRRIYTQAWMEQGIDLAYQHFRQPEYGIWENKILGWSFVSVEQDFGIPFAVHLLRRGLWSSQIFTPFEDAGEPGDNVPTATYG